MREINGSINQRFYELLGHAIISKEVMTAYHPSFKTITFSPYVLGVKEDGLMCCLLYLHTPTRVQGADLNWTERYWLCIPLSSFNDVNSVQDSENEQWIETDRDLEVYVKVLL